jgi:hypothetical protein
MIAAYALRKTFIWLTTALSLTPRSAHQDDNLQICNGCFYNRSMPLRTTVHQSTTGTWELVSQR